MYRNTTRIHYSGWQLLFLLHASHLCRRRYSILRACYMFYFFPSIQHWISDERMISLQGLLLANKHRPKRSCCSRLDADFRRSSSRMWLLRLRDHCYATDTEVGLLYDQDIRDFRKSRMTYAHFSCASDVN